MYLDDLKVATNKTTTENGAVAHKSSLNPLVDFFALAGATRRNPDIGLDLFKKAYSANPQGAVRVLFYLRDIRGGQGERQLFRNCLRYLSESEPKVAEQIVSFVPEYGRYDDLFAMDTEIIGDFVATQLEKDRESSEPTLLAKWMPSENTSSLKTRTMARALMKILSMSPSEYRKMLSGLRKKIGLVEQKMSAKEFDSIDYSKIPSQAGLKYKKAFFRNDQEGYQKFLDALNKGETTVNTGTLFPYQVYDRVDEPGSNELWANLPDYTQDKNAIVVADVSGSMTGQPMSVAVSLALYFAERNEGIFKDHFITFSENPQLQAVKGSTLKQRMNSIESANWGFNTDVNAVFKLLVDTAVKNNADPSEMPETIYIISDMQFDHCAEDHTNFEVIDAMYEGTDYKRPNLVFWNVRAAHKQTPVLADDMNTTLVSGYSPAAFALAVENKTPEDLVNDVINSERYTPIEISV